MVDALADTGVDRQALQQRTLRSLRFAQVPGQAAVAGMVAVVSLLASDLLGSDRLAGMGSASFTVGFVTVIVNVCVAGLPTPLLAFTVTLNAPTVVGVPDSAPLDCSVRPVGSGPEPAFRENVGTGLPLAAKVWL